MLRKLFTVTALATVSAATLVATGCASNNADGPSALTGDRTTQNDNWRYTDSKGHYRPELRADAHRAAAQPKSGGGNGR